MTLKLRKGIKVDETFMPAGIYPNIPRCAVNAIMNMIGDTEFWANIIIGPDPVENWGRQSE